MAMVNVRRLTGLLAIPLSSTVLSSCLGVSYDFVSHQTSAGESTYFKIPQAWTLFHSRAIVQEEFSKATPATVNKVDAVSWANIFMGLPGQRLSKNIGFQGSIPVGLARADELSGTARQGFSLSSLRTLVLPSDPLSATAPTGYSYKVLSYKEFVRPGGFRGSQLYVDITTPNGGNSTYIQDAVVNAQTSWVYMIAVGCDASCFKNNQTAILSIVDSWNVKVVS